VIGVLLRHFLARGDVGAAASLLAHPQRAHRVSALYNLGVLQKGGADLRPLLPALEAAASDPSDEVRGRAAKLVAAIGAR
jgi:HEAT repeat protein